MISPLRTVVFTCLLSSLVGGQTLSTRPSQQHSGSNTGAPTSLVPIPLVVPAGTPLKIALDEEVTVRKKGEAVRGRVVEPVYAFDKLVIPAGAEVTGRIAHISDPSKIRRTLAAMNADFSPHRDVRIEFDDLTLAEGRHLALPTVVAPANAGVLELVPAAQKERPGLGEKEKEAARGKISAVKQQIRGEWELAKKQVHEPGKVHRLERYGVAQLPYHPQYLDAGTVFNADLVEPLNFGLEQLPAESLTSIGTQPPAGSIVHAVLTTPLNSATTHKGDQVEAVITQPLVVSNHLILPEGSRIEGSVLQVRPARKLKRNGQLRVVFHRVVPPNGIEQNVEASLEGVAVKRGEHLRLDSEGGAEVRNPRTRYLDTALSMVLAAKAVEGDPDEPGSGSNSTTGAGNGASGFKLIGTAAGTFVHSRVLASGLGFYGAGLSVYYRFLARGKDVVYPKDMSMIVGLGTRGTQAARGSE